MSWIAEKRDQFDPIQIQIVCRALENKVVNENLKLIKLSDIPDISDIIKTFYQNTWKRVQSDSELDDSDFQEMRYYLLNKLVVNSRRVPVPLDVIKEESKITDNEINTLVRNGLLLFTYVFGSQKFVVLAHDRMIAPLLADRRSIKARKNAEASKMEEIALLEAAQEKRSKRRKVIAIVVLSVGMLLCLGLAGVAYIQTKEANEQRKEANTQREEAEKTKRRS